MLRGTWKPTGGASVELLVMLAGMEYPVDEQNRYRYYFGGPFG